MRRLLPTLLLIFSLLALPGALAQTRAQMTLAFDAPSHTLAPDAAQVVLEGFVTFTGDILQYQQLSGIPITYTVTEAPAWANVVVSPASDVIPLPSFPTGVSFTAMRPVRVVVSLLPEFVGRDVQTVEITVSQGPVTGGQPATAKAAMPIAVDARPEEPCDLHEIETLIVLPPIEEPAEPASSEGVTVQSTQAAAIPAPAVAVGGLALAGAGLGLVLRRRFSP